MDITKEFAELVHNLKPMRRHSLDGVKILTNRWFKVPSNVYSLVKNANKAYKSNKLIMTIWPGFIKT